MLYSYFLTSKERTLEDAKKELSKSLDKAYELYHALFVLMIDLTNMQDLHLDEAKHKYIPSEEDLNPNMRFVENGFVEALKNNQALEDYKKETPISWQDDYIFMKLMLEKVLNSDIYQEYMSADTTDFKNDCDFWKNILKKVILPDEDFAELLESKSVYWNDDLDIMSTFTIKTINKWAIGGKQDLFNMYKDKEDAAFGEELFMLVVKNRQQYDEIIDMFIQTESWDKDRIPIMDRIILMTAIAEIINFPKIPTRVTMNEYIEIAKYYSTAKSGIFVNGILNTIINYLKKEGTISKTK